VTDERTVEVDVPPEWLTTPIRLPEGHHAHAWGEGPVHDHAGGGAPHHHLNGAAVIEEKSDVPPKPLGFRTIKDVREARKAPVWLVREALLADAFGVIGGAEKTLKSMILTLFTIAVGSGNALFCDKRFEVKERGKVLVLTGEGSVDLFLDRLEHLCKLCDIDPAELDDWVEVTDEILPTTSDLFRHGLMRRIEDFNPALVILDPAYVYVAADEQAGNVFTMGKLLANLRDLCRGRAVLVGHHFTKAAKDDLSLGSLTQAGFREVFDHWLLVAHAQDPDLDKQHFKLHARLGARRGFAWDATFEVTLGRFDLDELRHEGSPEWKVLAPESRTEQKNGADWRRLVYEHIGAEPERLTKSEIIGRGEGCNARAKAFAFLEERSLITQVGVNRPRQNGRPVPVKVWRQTTPGVLFDDALAVLREATP